MSARDSLKKLIKRFPAPVDLKATLDGLYNDTDRSAAIIGAAIIESLLERYITKHFKDSDPKLIEQIFLNRGPLSDFHGKILIANAFGIVAPAFADELHRVKVIRNVFAHAASIVSFDDRELVAEMSRNTVLKTINETNVGDAPARLLVPQGKRGFVLTVQIMCELLNVRHQAKGGDPLLAKFESNSSV